MGIPHYFHTIVKEYDDIITSTYNHIPDYYFIDFNGMIHQAAYKALSEEQNTDSMDSLVQKYTWDYLQKTIDILKVNNSIYVCADGIAPIAKINQQRKRRYISTFEKLLKNTANTWDKNAISPATEFMSHFNSFMKQKIRNTPTSYIMSYSGTDEIGEGEHKIMARIRGCKNTDNIIIYGLDADLIMLSLISHHPNITLMRENTKSGFDDEFIYLNISKLRKAIIHKLLTKYHWNLPQIDDTDIYSDTVNNIIEVYIILCFLVGNDFLPHIPSLSLKKNGHDRILYAFKDIINTWDSECLVKDNKINPLIISQILTILSKDENDIIIKLNDEYLRKEPYPGSDEYQSYPIQKENKSKLASLIKASPTKWRINYYKELFNSNLDIINDSCSLYIQGIQWIYLYYKQLLKDDRWYYPYAYAPTVLDLANYSQSLTSIEYEEYQKTIHPYVQLLAILPIQSIDLFPIKLQKLILDPKYGLAHQFPVSYNIECYLKTYLWECNPIIPSLDIELIEECLKQV
jgi:5'-3' exonuclease